MKNLYICILSLAIVLPKNLFAQPNPGVGINPNSMEQRLEIHEMKDRERQMNSNRSSFGEDLLLGGLFFGLVGATILSNSSRKSQPPPPIRRSHQKSSTFSAKMFVLDGGTTLLNQNLNTNWKRKGRRVSGEVGLSMALTPTFAKSRVYGKWFYASRGSLFKSDGEDFFINSALISNPTKSEYPLLEDGNIEMRNQYMGAGMFYRISISDNFFTDIGSGFMFNQNTKVLFHESDINDENKKFRYIDRSDKLISKAVSGGVLNYNQETLKDKMYYKIGFGYGKSDVFGRIHARAYGLNANSGTNFPFVVDESFLFNKTVYLETNISIGINLSK